MNRVEITSETIAHWGGRPDGSVHLVALKLDARSLDKLEAELGEHGASVGKLEVSFEPKGRGPDHSLVTLDFAQACPNLVEAAVTRCWVNDSILLHPTLKKVRLERCRLYTADPLILGNQANDSPLEELSLQNVNWGTPAISYRRHSLETFVIGPGAQLRVLDYHVEDSHAEMVPAAIELVSCMQLERVRIRVEGTPYELKLRGDFPALRELEAASGLAEHHSTDFSMISGQSSDFALSLRSVTSS